jgi:hypothetical protein
MKKEKNMTWYDVTLYQFNEIEKAVKIEDDTERVFRLAEIVYGEDVTNLPLKDFNVKVKQLAFLKDEIPNKIPPKKIEVNGRKYFLDCLLGNVTTAQYVDFTNQSNTGDLSKMLSVFVIPEGHKYNDGYDMLQVMDDINSLPIPIVNSIAFFFAKQINKFMEIFQSYSIKQIQKMKLPKETKANMIKAVKDSMDLALFPLYSNFAR